MSTSTTISGLQRAFFFWQNDLMEDEATQRVEQDFPTAETSAADEARRLELFSLYRLLYGSRHSKSNAPE